MRFELKTKCRITKKQNKTKLEIKLTNNIPVTLPDKLHSVAHQGHLSLTYGVWEKKKQNIIVLQPTLCCHSQQVNIKYFTP